jgi:hypothetical protein
MSGLPGMSFFVSSMSILTLPVVFMPSTKNNLHPIATLSFLKCLQACSGRATVAKSFGFSFTGSLGEI